MGCHSRNSDLSEMMTTPFLAFLGGCLGVMMMLSPVARADVHYYDFVLKETNFTRLCLDKTMMTVNDSFPGPTIHVHRGDTLYVNVYNEADFGVTIHWHGVKNQRNPWSDGPVYITQCPIEPGNNFTYEVIFSREEGTLWWHAHSDWTRASVHGAIVILPAEGTGYPFPEPDGQEVVVLSSWFIDDLNNVLEEEDLEAGVALPQSDAYTINGQPGDFCNCSKGMHIDFENGNAGPINIVNIVTRNSYIFPMSESTYHWLVDPGKTYLIRLVAATMDMEMFFAISDHNLTVVGIDGSYIKPLVTSYVMISPGQTMDILVTMNQSAGRYYMAARQFDTARPDVSDDDRRNATSILQYTGNYTDTSPPSFPNTTLPTNGDLTAGYHFRSHLKSLANEDYPVDVPVNITTRMYIVVSINEIARTNESGVYDVATADMNNVSWANPSIDILSAYYWNISGIYTDDFPDWPTTWYDFSADNPPDDLRTISGTKVKFLDYNEEVEIVFQGTNGLKVSQDHPMHLHGYSFYVVGYGKGNYSNVTDPETYNLIDPPEQTTVAVPKQGWAAIRFRANNPGVWLWHCHFDRHYTWGMNTVFIVRDGGTPETSLRKPPTNMPMCTAARVQLLGAHSSMLGYSQV